MKKFKPDALKTGIKFGHGLDAPGDLAAILPACSLVLPFLLLIIAALRLPLAKPVACVRPRAVAGRRFCFLAHEKIFSLDWMPASVPSV